MSKNKTKGEETRNVTSEEVKQDVVQEVAVSKKEGKKAKFSSPPKPPVVLDGVKNPITEQLGLKRALATAIAFQCVKDGKLMVDEVASLIRHSGILYKAGYKEEEPTPELCQGEWSGKSYARWAGKNGKNYELKFGDKVEKCREFAEKLTAMVRS